MSTASMFIYEVITDNKIQIVVALNKAEAVNMIDSSASSPQIRKLGCVTADVVDNIGPGIYCTQDEWLTHG